MAVAALDLLCVLVLAPFVRRIYVTIREMLSRLLALLLAGVGVSIFLQGLAGLGVLPHYRPG